MSIDRERDIVTTPRGSDLAIPETQYIYRNSEDKEADEATDAYLEWRRNCALSRTSSKPFVPFTDEEITVARLYLSKRPQMAGKIISRVVQQVEPTDEEADAATDAYLEWRGQCARDRESKLEKIKGS